MSQFSGNAERLTGSNRGVFPLYAGASTCRFQARSVFNICNICKYGVCVPWWMGLCACPWGRLHLVSECLIYIRSLEGRSCG